MLTPLVTLGQVLDAPGGRALLERHLPEAVLDQPGLRVLLIGAFLRVAPGLRDDEAARELFWNEIDKVMAPILLHEHAPAVTPAAPDPSAPRATAAWTLVGEPSRWEVLEIALQGPAAGNPFVDVELSAEWTCSTPGSAPSTGCPARTRRSCWCPYRPSRIRPCGWWRPDQFQVACPHRKRSLWHASRSTPTGR